jgi:hypothetical protein
VKWTPTQTEYSALGKAQSQGKATEPIRHFAQNLPLREKLGMKKILQNQTRWARWNGGARWTVAIATPTPPELIQWITQNYRIERVQVLPSGNAAYLLRSTPKTVAALMELPKPKNGGSRHECNLVIW